MSQIRVTVNTKGESRVEAEGFAGTSCQDATRQITAALGKVIADDPKPELYENTVTETATVSQ